MYAFLWKMERLGYNDFFATQVVAFLTHICVSFKSEVSWQGALYDSVCQKLLSGFDECLDWQYILSLL